MSTEIVPNNHAGASVRQSVTRAGIVWSAEIATATRSAPLVEVRVVAALGQPRDGENPPIRLTAPPRASGSGGLRLRFGWRRVATSLLWAALTLAAVECGLLFYYLNSWVIFPTL